MAADDEARRPDPAGAAARSMTHLAQQMRDMAERMLSGALPGWPLPGSCTPSPANAWPCPGTTRWSRWRVPPAAASPACSTC